MATRLKKAKAHWMGAVVRVFPVEKGRMNQDKVLKGFKAGSRNMPEAMARWAARNGYDIINLRRDRRTGTLKVWL